MTNSIKKKEYNAEYAKKNLKRIPLDVQKDKYEEIKEAALAAGEPVNRYIKKAIDSYPELFNSFIVTFSLDKDIAFNSEIFSELEQELLNHSNCMNGFITQGSTKGEYKLLLRFRKKNEDFYKIIQNFSNILNNFEIDFSYSEITVLPDKWDTL